MKHRLLSSSSLRFLPMGLMLGLLMLTFASCEDSDNQKNTINRVSLTTGKWLQANKNTSSTERIYWRYRSDGSGVSWDENTDTNYYVGEDESNMVFTWSVEDNNLLKHVFRGEQGNQGITKYYTVVSMDATSMVWEDAYGDKITLSKR